MRADELAIHPKAQRAIVKSHLKYLTEKLDLDAIGTLHAVKYLIRGVEKLWIVDGQHRLRALLDNGFGEWMVDVMLHTDVRDDVGANRLFLHLNTKKTPTSFEKFTAGERAKEEDAVGVTKSCAAHGLKIKPGTADGCVACVDKLRKIWRHDSGRMLSLTLDVLRDAWGYVSASVEGVIIEGLARVLMQHTGKLDIAVLVQKLAKYPGGAGALHGDAKGRLTYRRSSVSRCVSEIIVETYNSGRRSGKV